MILVAIVSASMAFATCSLPAAAAAPRTPFQLQGTFAEVEAGLVGSEAAGVSIENGYARSEENGVLVPVGSIGPRDRAMFFTADLRALFMSPSKGERQDRGVTFRHDGGASYSGGFVHDQKVDAGAVIIGGGIRF